MSLSEALCVSRCAVDSSCLEFLTLRQRPLHMGSRCISSNNHLCGAAKRINVLHPQANGYQIDFDDWHAAVHGTLPYERMLHEDKAMRELLQSIDLPKYVFTNADTKHAEICLRLLGIADLFQVIIFSSPEEAC